MIKQKGTLNILSDLLMVVEVGLDAFDDLVVLVAFAGDEDDVTGLGEGTGGLDGCSTVFDDEGREEFVRRESVGHVLEDGGGFFVTGVVGGEDELFGAAFGYLRHHRSFAFVTVAATADNRYQTGIGD